ncbi:MAG: hypothetical protein ABI599_05060 [Flavobacteriales bacterium]
MAWGKGNKETGARIKKLLEEMKPVMARMLELEQKAGEDPSLWNEEERNQMLQEMDAAQAQLATLKNLVTALFDSDEALN